MLVSQHCSRTEACTSERSEEQQKEDQMGYVGMLPLATRQFEVLEARVRCSEGAKTSVRKAIRCRELLLAM